MGDQWARRVEKGVERLRSSRRPSLSHGWCVCLPETSLFLGIVCRSPTRWRSSPGCVASRCSSVPRS